MYVLLGGKLPFSGDNDKEILAEVEKGNISFDDPQWRKISKEGRCLVKKMLTYNPKNRISSEAALNDVWLDMFKKNTEKVGNEQILETMQNLRSFKLLSNMQKAVFTYLAAHVINEEEERRHRKIFEQFDVNHDGQLSVDELVEGYKMLFNGDEKLARKEAERTLKRIDLNKNGNIDFNGKKQ